MTHHGTACRGRWPMVIREGCRLGTPASHVVVRPLSQPRNLGRTRHEGRLGPDQEGSPRRAISSADSRTRFTLRRSGEQSFTKSKSRYCGERCGAPTNVGDSGEIFGYEEGGTLWLWSGLASSGGHMKSTWLFSPVTGKRPWPGDLRRGVDAAGDLLIVEAKLAERTRGTDPFQDLLSTAPFTSRPTHR